MLSESKRIAFYIRSATGSLDDLVRQRRRLEKEFVKRKADFIGGSVEIYRDTHQSGLQPGPEFQRMCDDAAAGKIGVIMVERMNRISRCLGEYGRFIDFIEKHQVRFVSANENLDSLYCYPDLYAAKEGSAQ